MRDERTLLALLTWTLVAAAPPPPGAPGAPQDGSDPPAQDPPAQETPQETSEAADPHRLAPPVSRPDLVQGAREALDRGFAFLVVTQNPDGSWGSHDPQIANLANFGFQLRNRGSQDGVRLACTAICATALMEKRGRNAAEERALSRAIEALLGTEKLAYHRGEAFNTWGYGYKLDFLTRYLGTPAGEQRRERIAAAAKVCIDGLARFQQADGGWNYYAGPTGGGQSMSFNTADFAAVLMRARARGLAVPEGCAGDAIKLLRRMRTEKGGFVYDARFLLSPGSVNELSAGSRTATCALALHDAGVFGSAELMRSLEVFDEGENYLEDGRKLIQPHTAVHQISGYFFFYGYNYASEIAARLGDAVSPERWDRFAWTMLRTQEQDGRWWDTAAADYGDKWGTGFALQVLQRYLGHVERSPEVHPEADGAQGAER